MTYVYLVRAKRAYLCVCKTLALAEKYIQDVSENDRTTPADYSIHMIRWIE